METGTIRVTMHHKDALHSSLTVGHMLQLKLQAAGADLKKPGKLEVGSDEFGKFFWASWRPLLKGE